MTRSSARLVAVLSLCAAPSVARGQSAEDPNFILSIIGGVTYGGTLWELPRQLVRAPGGAYDTVRLARRLTPGLVASVLATYHRAPRLGYVAEIGYFGVASEARCVMIGPPIADAEQKNRQACVSANGAHYRTSVVAAQVGLTYRLEPTAFISPYARATAGFGLLGNSYIETAAVVAAPTTCSQFGGACPVWLLFEGGRRGAALVASLTGGAVWRAGRGYQVRLEIRDFIAGLPIAADSAGSGSPEPFPTAPSGTRTRHTLTFTAGLDVILERRHRRRY